MSQINLIGYNNAIFLKKITDILEYIFISYQMKLDKVKNIEIKELLNIDENLDEVKKLLKIIFYLVKVIEVLYLSNSEKKNNQMIYDYLVNKVIIKCCPKINDIILNYTVYHLKIIFPKIAALDRKNVNNINNYNKINIRHETNSEIQEREDIFEVISFIVLNQINYRSNFFFVEFKTTNNIYENLPFNYLFLNMFSKYLIRLFTRIIAKTNFEDLNLISENMIILCLKGLYLLDGDINFTPNREEFWNNMELVGKMTAKDNTFLLEKIKLIPFIFPLKTRLDIGVKEIKRLKEERMNSIRNMRNNINFFGNIDEEMIDVNESHIKIPRESIFNSTFMYYMQNMLSPYGRWIVTFIDKLGQVETGVDAGGLYKEFMYKLSEEAFSSKLGYFEESETGLLLPTRDSLHVDKNYNFSATYEFLGFIVAKSIFDEIKIFPNFSPIFLNNCLEVENSFIDLKTYDPDLYKSLVTLKTYEGDVKNDLGLYFSLTIEKNGKNVTFELIDGGNNIPVTNENRLTYIKKVTDYYLTFQFKEAVENFRNGMSKVINMDILRLYSGEELRQIIYGFDKDVFTVTDMEANSKFTGFNMKDPKEVQCINDFYKILEEFSQKEKEKFLFFCTSLKRLPIGGFQRLRPTFHVTKSFNPVPTSSTCVNMLKLPILPYQKLKDILLYVINADAGFYYA
jgi:ubiquitin-protein ligase E3 C